MSVNGGDVENATSMDYFMHFVTFAWKVDDKFEASCLVPQQSKTIILDFL